MSLGRSNSLSINTGAANTSLFGNTNSNPSAQQPSAPSLFGQQPTSTGTNLFGNNNTTTQAPTTSLFGQQPANNNTGLFGNTNAANTQPATNSIFGQQAAGNNAPSQPAQASQSLFAPSNQNMNASTLFGNSQSMQPQPQPQPQQQQAQVPSLLGATMRTQQNQGTAFGRLSMGQSTASPAATVGGVKIDLENLRSTTRFEDCIDPIREQLESIDRMIQLQESYAKQIEAFLPKHGQDVQSITPDVDLVKDKAEAVEEALAMDASGVEAARTTTQKDARDFERCQRVVTNLTLPRQYQYSPMTVNSSIGAQQRPASAQPASTSSAADDGSTYDTDLIGNYFSPLAAELQRTMGAYAGNLTEIEAHMRVIEHSAVTQAQHLAQRKSGVSGPNGNGASGSDTVRELADTLRGFEQSILGVASVVGGCREGVNELLLGRLAGGSGY